MCITLVYWKFCVMCGCVFRCRSFGGEGLVNGLIPFRQDICGSFVFLPRGFHDVSWCDVHTFVLCLLCTSALAVLHIKFFMQF